MQYGPRGNWPSWQDRERSGPEERLHYLKEEKEVLERRLKEIEAMMAEPGE